MYKISYDGDDVTLNFVFAFPFFNDADVKVAINEKILSTDEYSVIANQYLDGGEILLNHPPKSGDKIDIFRQIELIRTIDYQPIAKINPQNLNADFNFLLEAFKDLKEIDIDLIEWKNIHQNTVQFLEYTNSLVLDGLTGGGVLGLYNNLLSVLDNALPKLINDYGYITDVAPNENKDDYGIL